MRNFNLNSPKTFKVALCTLLTILASCSQDYGLSMNTPETAKVASTNASLNPDGSPSDPRVPLNEVMKSQSFNVAPQERKIDLLFVIDNSGSMSDEQGILGNSFNKFISSFQNRNLSFRIGIITTDTYAKTLNGFQTGGPGSLVAFGTNDRILTNKTPNLAQQFNQNINVGVTGSGSEMGIAAATLALSPENTGPGKWNENFLRPDAFLSIIFVSDEDEAYVQGKQDDLRDNTHAKDLRFALFKNALEAAKPNKLNLVRADAVVGPKGVSCSALDQGLMYIEIAELYNGKTTSICEDFSTGLTNLGAEIATQVQSSFALIGKTQKIHKVTLNGDDLDLGIDYVYHADKNSVQLLGPALAVVESMASVVDIQYSVLE